MPGDRQDMRRRLHEVAFGQAGYFSAAQAKAAGYSYQAQKYHVDHGNWLRVDRGLFRLPGWPGGSDDSYARWTVWSQGRAVVSHESALAVHDLSDANPARVDLTVPPNFLAKDDAVRLHHATLPPADVEDRGSWRVTDVDRTLRDIAHGDTPQEIVTDAVSDALRTGKSTRRRLLHLSAESADRGALRLERALAQAVEA